VFFGKNVDLSSTQGALLCTVSVFFILHFTYLGGGVRMHPTPPVYGPEPPISGHVRGPKLEVQMAESGGRGVLEEGATSPSLPPPGFVGSAVSSPSWVRAQPRPLKSFLAFYRGAIWLLLELVWGQVRGRGHVPLSPTDSAYVSYSSRRPVGLHL